MTTNLEEMNDLPGESYVKVGSSLEAAPNLSKEKSEERGLNKPEEQFCCSGGGNKTGVLITEGRSVHSESISEISVNTFDIDAANELYADENGTKSRRIIYALTCVCVMLVYLLYQTSSGANAREKLLLAQIDELKSEMNQLRFDNEMVSFSKNAQFEIDNCYFNIQASGRLGACAEDLTQSAEEWYDWSMSGINSFLEDSMSDGAENQNDPMSAYDLWNDWSTSARDSLASGFNSFLEDVLNDGTENQDDAGIA